MNRFASKFRAKLLAGIVVTVPIIVTILALRFLFRSVDSVLGPAIARLIGYEVPGLGLLATLALVLIAGVVSTNLLGKRLIVAGERVFTELPLVRRIYNAVKDIVASATLSQRQAFRDVVMVEYPRRGLYSYGFVTSRTTRNDGDETRRFVNVFIPGPPVPTTGVLVAVPEGELFYLDISIEEGLKLVLSGGMAAPPELNCRPETPAEPGARE